ncbi:type II toxin-antitoxin system VapC family toxin [bacterium]|nr:type II toxin-antitoxin system VapC family toxin [bacterium]
MTNLVDSSGWLEYLTGGINAELFGEPLIDKKALIVPSVILTEVFRVILREKDESSALQVAAVMQQSRVIDLTTEIAVYAAKLSMEKNLPMAGGIILSTAYLYDAEIWTQDADLRGIHGVKFISKS